MPITAKVFDALVILATNHGRVVEKDDLLQKIWPDTVVEEGSLHHCVSALRKVLGEKADGRRFIATIPGRGYSFIPAVRVRPAGAATAKPFWQRRQAIPWGAVAIVLVVAAGWAWLGSTRQKRAAPRLQETEEADGSFTVPSRELVTVCAARLAANKKRQVANTCGFRIWATPFWLSGRYIHPV